MKLGVIILLFMLSQSEGFSYPSNLLANTGSKMGTEIPKYFVRPREMDPKVMKDVERLINLMMTDMKEFNFRTDEQIRKGKYVEIHFKNKLTRF